MRSAVVKDNLLFGRWDIDDILHWRAQKTVVIRDRKLCIANLGIILGILVYTILYALIYQQGYLKTDKPMGSIRMTLHDPSTLTPINDNSQATYCSQKTTPPLPPPKKEQLYGQVQTCIPMDYPEVIYPAGEVGNMGITTRLSRSEMVFNRKCRLQTLLCDKDAERDPPDVPCTPSDDKRCCCVMSSKETDFVYGVENYTLRVMHSVYGLSNGVELSWNRMKNRALKNYVTNEVIDNFREDGSSCDEDDACDFDGTGGKYGCKVDGKCVRNKGCAGYRTNEECTNGTLSYRCSWSYHLGLNKYDGVCNEGGDTRPLHEWLLSADIRSLDEAWVQGSTKRYEGLILLLVIEYTGEKASLHDLNYNYKLVPLPLAEWKAVQYQWFASHMNSTGHITTFIREGYNRHGIRIIGIQTGQVGQFSFLELMKTLVTATTLFGVAKFLVRKFVVKFLPFHGLYEAYMHTKTVDFSDVYKDYKSGEYIVKTRQGHDAYRITPTDIISGTMIRGDAHNTYAQGVDEEGPTPMEGLAKPFIKTKDAEMGDDGVGVYHSRGIGDPVRGL